ncbi:MAG: DNA polymerase I [Clostridia bacterium]|nr:DNA polymerase I [Clostridia bacterium]
MKHLLVIDGNSILNRQYYGIRPLTTKEGIFTNAVFGFTKVLLHELDTLSPDYAAVAFDLKDKTFRHKTYDAYKAGRHKMPEELAMQFPYAKEMIAALGCHVLSLSGYEADDILGTLSRMAEEDTHTYLLTGDRDALQLVSPTTTVLLCGNKETTAFTPEVFFEKYGVSPTQFIDVKALMGDSSDNIPGVSGVGEKTALKMIAEAGSLDGVYENLPAYAKTPALFRKMSEGKDSAYLSKFLATIVCDVPLGITLEDLVRKPNDTAALSALFTKLEFTAFHKLLTPTEDTPAPKETALLAAESITLPELFGRTFQAPTALWIKEGAIYLADSAEAASGVRIDAEAGDLPTVLAMVACPLIVHDSKALYHLLSKETLPEVAFDTLLAAYTLDATGSQDIEKLSLAYLKTPFSQDNPAVSLYRLYQALEDRLTKEDTLPLYRDVEAPLAAVLYRMEKRGFLVDLQMLEDFSRVLDRAAEGYMEEIFRLCDKRFNINSPKQLGEVLFEDLKLPVFKKTKSGYSTDAEVLDKLRPYHPVIDLITEYRQAVKFKSTYADALPKLADAGGRVHTSFHQTVTATGRLSSSDPNLQNIPVRTELGREFRRAFSAKEGHLLVDADYSQIELRLLAALSGDEKMIAAFQSGADIHRITASEVFKVPLDAVTPELRKRAKAVNFGIVYGIGGYSLSGDIGVSVKEAGQYIKTYKETYSGVDRYLQALITEGKEKGYVKTHYERRRYIPELTAQKAALRAFGERVAMNSPIQGTAADIIKIAMLRVEKALAEKGLAARLILQVHDELIIEAPEAEADAVKALLQYEMENAVTLRVPLTVEVSVGKTWYDCK